MTVFQALVLGVLQGLAEFLPISSSAHLALAPWAFGWPEPGLAVDVALHVGTLVAVLVYFREEWIRLIVAAGEIVRTQRIQSPEQRRVIYLIVATIPGGLAGVALNDYAESTFRSPLLIGSALAAMGVLLWIVDKARPATRPLEAIRWSDAILVGIAQAFAILPGVSRSGATITAGRALALDRESAATFSFLMSMPIIAAAAIFKVPHLLHSGGAGTPLLVGVLAAAVSGWLAIEIVMRYVRTHSYGAFALYRVVIGAAAVVLFWTRARG
ncbi:MAG TPA: undecaprenyl-diphosphate phosphatase [Gemmatimonadaceae bacterium]|nr:undecaprenyl-diphosphate phosphatase [Gemmatimonadaceae bacterium]